MKVLAAGNALVRTLGAGPDTSPAQAIVVEGGAGVTEYATIEELVTASEASLAPGYYEALGVAGDRLITYWDGTNFNPPVVGVDPVWTEYWAVEDLSALAHDANVTSWIDRVSGSELIGAGATLPKYRTDATRPYVTPNGGRFDSIVSSPQPNTIVFAFASTAAGGSTGVFWDGAGAGRNHAYVVSGIIDVFSGAIVGSTINRSPDTQMLAAVYNDTASILRLNQVTSGPLNPGSQGLDNLRLFQNTTGVGQLDPLTQLRAVFVARGHAATTAELDRLHLYCHQQYGARLCKQVS